MALRASRGISSTAPGHAKAPLLNKAPKTPLFSSKTYLTADLIEAESS